MDIKLLLNSFSEDFFISNSKESIEYYKRNGSIDDYSLEKRTMAFEPASAQSVEDKERQLGVTLPPSYVEFLMVSNGFRVIWTCLDNLLPVEKIDWSKNTEDKWSLDLFKEDTVEVSDEQYFYYGEDQDTVFSKTSYIPESLKISEWYDGLCLFLNPLVKFGEEWEVLEFATWHPGIRRFKSFRDYLININMLNKRAARQ